MAVFVKMEGWDVPLELRVVAQVSPAEASCVVAGVGTLRQVEDRVLTPSIRAITRDVAGGSYEITEAGSTRTASRSWTRTASRSSSRSTGRPRCSTSSTSVR